MLATEATARKLQGSQHEPGMGMEGKSEHWEHRLLSRAGQGHWLSGRQHFWAPDSGAESKETCSLPDKKWGLRKPQWRCQRAQLRPGHPSWPGLRETHSRSSGLWLEKIRATTSQGIRAEGSGQDPWGLNGGCEFCNQVWGGLAFSTAI